MLIQIVGGERKYALQAFYPVIAIYFFTPQLQFMIDAEGFPSAPTAIDEANIQIVDRRVSRHWLFSPGVEKSSWSMGRVPMMAFREWSEDGAFFEKLVNGEAEAQKVWARTKTLMNLEFAAPNMRRVARDVGNGLLLCDSCSEVLTAPLIDELVSCPKCFVVQRCVPADGKG
jgi:hypothetical protein